MRKVRTLLLLAATAFLGLPAFSGLAEAALEPTESGAPSAIVIFPVGEKPNPFGAGMAPVAYNHVIHEKWAKENKKDCVLCHHTGDPVACTTCHTMEGKAEGNFVTIKQAMHTEKIAPRKDKPTPVSCMSCHNQELKQRECAGCHTSLVRNAKKNTQWCATCHQITPSISPAQIQEGIQNKLPEQQNEALAESTAEGRKQAEYWTTMLAPYKVVIDSLKGEYAPSVFNHRHHVAVLMEKIQANKLAGAFHAVQPATLCVTCHHRSPASPTPPKCSSCHSKNINPQTPQMPSLMAAYHLQCMSCHTDMKVARPRPTDCSTCHKPNTAKVAAKAN